MSGWEIILLALVLGYLLDNLTTARTDRVIDREYPDRECPPDTDEE